MKPTYDVVVVGAGPGGSACAGHLSQQGYDVVLVDKAEFPRDKTCGDALTPRALAMLDKSGVLRELLPGSYPITGAEIYAPNGQFIATPIPQVPGAPGQYMLIVPRMRLDNVLREKAIASGAQFVGGVHVTDMEQDENYVVVKGVKDGEPIAYQARMTVIATGASVKLLLKTGILTQTPAMMVAARAYYEGVQNLSDRVQLRFDGVTLPGYGWVFPISKTSANIGAGFFARGRDKARMPVSPQAAFEQFTSIPALQKMIGSAAQTSPVKGYPLRVDFTTAPTFGKRILLVGEAAGLVNPVSGDGIDYALESGMMAGGHLSKMLDAGDFSDAHHQEYDALLRERYQDLFIFCERIRDLCLKRPYLNTLMRVAAYREDLAMALIEAVLGAKPITGDLSAGRIARAVLGL